MNLEAGVWSLLTAMNIKSRMAAPLSCLLERGTTFSMRRKRNR